MDTIINRNWGWVFALGVILMLIGVFALGAPYVATFASILFLGWLLVFSGIAQFLYAFSKRRSGGFLMYALIAIVNILIGALIISNPAVSAATITLLLAVFFLGLGLFRIFGAMTLHFEHWGWVLVNGILEIILGVFILMHWPSSAVWALGLFIGIDFIFAGFTMIFGSFVLKNSASQ